jgi:predicted transcriptional regulator
MGAVRRVLPLLVFILLAIGSYGSSASLADESDASLSSPRVGDRATYEASVDGAKTVLSVVRGQATMVADATGAVHAVAPLEVRRADDDKLREIWWTTLGTQRPVASVLIERSDEASLLTPSTSSSFSHSIRFAAPGENGCLARAQFGQASTGDCWLSRMMHLRSTAANELRFEWARTISFPSRIRLGDAVSWELQTFDAGTRPYPALDATTLSSGLEASAKVPWGVDDDGIAHPFPLSTAFQRILSSSVPNEYNSWNSSQHDPQPAAAFASIDPHNGVTMVTWRLVIQGDSSYLVMSSSEPRLAKHNPASGTWLVDAGVLAPFTSVQRVNGLWGDHASRRAAIRWPRLAQVFEQRWSNILPSGPAPLTSWSFDVDCEARCPANEPLLKLEFSGDAWAALRDAPNEHPYSKAKLWLTPGGDAVAASFTSSQPMGWAEAPNLAAVPSKPVVQAQPSWTPRALDLLLAGLAAIFWKRFAALLGFGFRRPDAPDSETRQRILAAIQADPGVHFGSLRRTMGISSGTLDYHLAILLRRGDVFDLHRDGYRCFFTKGTKGFFLDAILAMKAAGARQITVALEGGAAMSATELGGKTGLALSTVSYHVQRMVRTGLLQEVITGRARTLRLSALAWRILGRNGPGATSAPGASTGRPVDHA